MNKKLIKNINKLCILIVITLLLISITYAYSNKPKQKVNIYINVKTMKNFEFTNYEINEFIKFMKVTYKNQSYYNDSNLRILKVTKPKKVSYPDIYIEVQDIFPYYGLAKPSNMIFDKRHITTHNSFLLLHEIGHAYGIGHTNDGSIMDANGGDRKYRDYQIQRIRKNIYK